MKKAVFVLAIVLPLAILLSACGPSRNFEVPKYATNGYVISIVLENVDKDNGVSHFEGNSNAMVSEGKLGYVVSQHDEYKLAESAYVYDSGQACSLHDFKNIHFQADTQTVKIVLLASTNNPTFLAKCQTQAAKSFPVYVVTVTKSGDGFLVTYTKEMWPVKIVFYVNSN